MDPMTPLDAAFLQIEDAVPEVSMAIASVAVFDGPSPTTAAFTELIVGRLPLIPRYRQKVRQVLFDLGPPVWVDDPDFDLGYHIRRTAVPAPGGDAELATLIGRIMSARLDRTRPLWEYWLIEGLAKGRWALLSKLHHCMADGVSGTALYHAILDPSPQPRAPMPDEWRPAAAPSGPALAVAAIRNLALNPLAQLSAAARLLRSPSATVTRGRQVVGGAVALSAAMWPVRASSLAGSLSAQRSYAFSRGTVADVAAVREAFGGTFNDVILAALTAGFRTLLAARGEEPHRDTIRTLVPVSVRVPGAEGVPDNRVSLMLAMLPVHVADPVERLTATIRQLGALKDAHEAEAGVALVSLAALEPFPATAVPMRAAARFAQRSVVSVATNVPGPRKPLYALGRRLREIVPYVPIGSTMRTGVSIFTYCDKVTFGVTGDRAATADADVLARGIADGLVQLAELARAGRSDGPTHAGSGQGRPAPGVRAAGPAEQAAAHGPSKTKR